MQQHLHRLMSGAIVRDTGLLTLLGSMRAEERVAAFLLHLSRGQATRGADPAKLRLTMTRAELGSYLGMKLETVSRVLSKLRRAGIIEVRAKHVRLLDMAGLQSG